jgi:hypothetical protein
MIIVRLTDGLGNQMFQYAVARNLAALEATNLKFDISWYQGKSKTQQKRQYCLDAFKIKEEFAIQNELDYFFNPQLAERLRRKVRSIFRFSPDSMIITEKSFEYDPMPVKSTKNVYLKGYWQSEKYFCNIREILLEDFSLKLKLSKSIEEKLQEILTCNSISLHIRRGDYVNDEQVTRVHGTLSLSYYKKCLEYIFCYVNNPCVFVFSDDLEWVRQNLNLPCPVTLVNGNKFEDLMLMSKCKHNIIANSSFSWWGAWLNQNNNKIVCAPEKWFQVSSRSVLYIVPSSWIKF